jgi:hypothetical protein
MKREASIEIGLFAGSVHPQHRPRSVWPRLSGMD